MEAESFSLRSSGLGEEALRGALVQGLNVAQLLLPTPFPVTYDNGGTLTVSGPKHRVVHRVECALQLYPRWAIGRRWEQEQFAEIKTGCLVRAKEAVMGHIQGIRFPRMHIGDVC